MVSDPPSTAAWASSVLVTPAIFARPRGPGLPAPIQITGCPGQAEFSLLGTACPGAAVTVRSQLQATTSTAACS